MKPSKEWLLANVHPVDNEKGYYRPYVLKDNGAISNIFIVGINPATEILKIDVDLERYIELLDDYKKFYKFYSSLRIKLNKAPISPTRRGINSLASRVEKLRQVNIFETNVLPYPAKDVKALYKLPETILNNARRIFAELIYQVKPEIIILHGIDAKEEFESNINLDLSFIDFSLRNSVKDNVYKLTYKDGGTCIILTCMHLRFYGYEGSRFELLHTELNKYL